ncbi:MAG: type II toxin-antitoxin system RatA family toxin [Pseudomonadota bacterium]|nr:type II toxin-antitoxin system RatA family toxin [Pseudomonadota bacterium]
MSSISRSVLITRPVKLVFDLINEVEGYPKRFDWCREATILERDKSGMTARLDLQYAGFNSVFTTRNSVRPLKRIDLKLVEGPFSDLRGSWSFTALGDSGCRVELDLDFEFAGRWVGSALAMGFQGLADRMVDDFSRAARTIDA